MRHRLPGRSGLLIAGVVALAALGACHDSSPDTRSTASGRPAAAPPADPVSTTQAGVEPCTFSGATTAAEGGSGAHTRLLTDVRAGVHECSERVTFEFKPMPGDAAGPVGWKVAYETGPITEDGSGRPVAVKGDAHLVVHLSAQSADLTKADAPPTYTGPTSLEAAGATRIQQIRKTGDFEGYITWVIGLDKQRPFKVTTQDDPARVVIDIGD
ncbi:MAG TPA: hypothetical protein VGP90_08065 [Acidimicrobiia bacterium]|nr:hypothetical protein [Acidimicrobiia bacterium]